MQLMFDKGILSREPKGKGHVYSSTIPEDEIQNYLLKKYTKTTSGKSAMKLVLQALGNQKESEEDLIEIKNYLNKL
jgi:predicted transcriptional regulator